MLNPNFSLNSNTIASISAINVTNTAFNVSSNPFATRIAIFAQPTVSSVTFNEAVSITSDKEAGDLFGYGSPIHLMAKQLYNTSRSISTIPCDVFPIDVASSSVAATGEITLSGTQTVSGNYTLKIGSTQYIFSLVSGDTAATVATKLKGLIDSSQESSVVTGTISSGTLPLNAKWKGETGNNICISLEGNVGGVVFAFVQLTGGSGLPDVSTALNNFKGVWYPFIVSQFKDTASLTNFEKAYIVGINPLKHQPFAVFLGDSEKNPSTLVSTYTAYHVKPTFSVLSIPSAQSIDFEGGASLCNLVSTTASKNPARPYNKAVLYGLDVDTEFTYEQNNLIELGGITPTYLSPEGLRVMDVITSQVTTDPQLKGYRYVVNVVKLIQSITDVNTLINGKDYEQRILVEDVDVTKNIYAIRPSTVRLDLLNLGQAWLETGVIRNYDAFKINLTVAIDPTNHDRLNVMIPIELSGALRQFDISILFST